MGTSVRKFDTQNMVSKQQKHNSIDSLDFGTGAISTQNMSNVNLGSFSSRFQKAVTVGNMFMAHVGCTSDASTAKTAAVRDTFGSIDALPRGS